MTYNMWKTEGKPTYWETRRSTLFRQLRQLDPDVMFVQELCPEITSCILDALPSHKCICPKHIAGFEDEGKASAIFDGWAYEGNIFFRGSLFDLVDWGQEYIEQEEPLRRLFWARLRPKCFQESHKTCLFSTAHFTWQGHQKEIESDVNLRKKQTRNTVACLNRLQVASDVACFFGGDLNESFWPKRILESATFQDCFTALSLPCLPTYPCRPTLSHEDSNADVVVDWLFMRGGLDDSNSKPAVKCLLAAVIKGSIGLSSDDPDEKSIMSVQPSDHAPVLAVYRLGQF